VLSLPDPEEVRAGTDYFSLLFLLTGVITGIGAYFQVRKIYNFNLPYVHDI